MGRFLCLRSLRLLQFQQQKTSESEHASDSSERPRATQERCAWSPPQQRNSLVGALALAVFQRTLQLDHVVRPGSFFVFSICCAVACDEHFWHAAQSFRCHACRACAAAALRQRSLAIDAVG